MDAGQRPADDALAPRADLRARTLSVGVRLTAAGKARQSGYGPARRRRESGTLNLRRLCRSPHNSSPRPDQNLLILTGPRTKLCHDLSCEEPGEPVTDDAVTFASNGL